MLKEARRVYALLLSCVVARLHEELGRLQLSSSQQQHIMDLKTKQLEEQLGQAQSHVKHLEDALLQQSQLKQDLDSTAADLHQLVDERMKMQQQLASAAEQHEQLQLEKARDIGMLQQKLAEAEACSQKLREQLEQERSKAKQAEAGAADLVC
jgi:chromosome segregation ATPase